MCGEKVAMPVFTEKHKDWFWREKPTKANHHKNNPTLQEKDVF